MIKEEVQRFLYRGNAVPFGAVLERPTAEIIDSQAATTLPITGGYGSARVENFRHRELMSFSAGYSQVSGSLSAQGDHFNTLVTATVENLNVGGILTAERIVARLTATHPKDGGEPRITPLGSHILNLRIGGRLIRCKSHVSTFDECDTYDKLQHKFQTDTKFHRELRDDFRWDELPQHVPKFVLKSEKERQGNDPMSPLPESKGFVVCSLLTNTECEDASIKCKGNVIIVPDFGVVYIGELIVTKVTRRITMLRIELGCPAEGRLMAGSVEGDGHTFP